MGGGGDNDTAREVSIRLLLENGTTDKGGGGVLQLLSVVCDTVHTGGSVTCGAVSTLLPYVHWLRNVNKSGGVRKNNFCIFREL